MQLKRIHIEGFGIFHNHVIDDLQPGLNLFLGANEAGKSTLLDFLRFTLFGYPHKREDRRPPLQGGRHGGWVDGALSDGRSFSLYRTADKKVGSIRLIEGEQESASENRWLELVRPASGEIYNNVYGITLKELWDVDTLSQSGVEERLFSIGLGLGKISLSDVEQNLQAQAEKYYKLSGSKQHMPQLLQKIKDKREKVHELQQKLPQYLEAKTKLDQLETDIENLEKQRQEQERDVHYYKTLLKCYEPFEQYQLHHEKLQQLPASKELPENGKEEIKRINQELERIDGQLKKVNQQITEAKEAYQKISIDESLLEQEDQVNHLRDQLAVYQEDVQQLAKDDDRLRELDQQVQSELQQLSPNWSEENVREITGLIDKQDRLRKWREQLQERDRQQKETRKNWEIAQEELTKLKRQEDQLQEEFEKIGKPNNQDELELNKKSDLVDRAESLLNRLQQAPQEQPQSRRMVFISSLLAIVMVIIAVAGFMVHYMNVAILAIFAALLFALIAVYFRTSSQKREPSADEQELQRLEHQLGFSSHSMSFEQLMDYKLELQKTSEQLKKWKDQEHQHQQKLKERQEAEQKAEERKQILQDNEQEYQQVDRQFRAFLREHGLSEMLTPDGALDAFRAIGEIKRLIDERDARKEERKARKKKIDQFEAQLREVVQSIPPIKTDDPVQQVRKLIDELENNQKNRQHLDDLDREINNKDKERNEYQENKKSEEKKKEKLLTQAGAENEEQFLELYRQNEQIQQYTDQKERAFSQIRGIAGIDKANDVISELGAMSKEQIRQYEEEASRKQEELKEELDTKRNERGELRQQLKTLSREGDLNESLTELENLKQQLQNAYEEWLSAQMALEVLQSTRQKYEKEKQPAVIHKANGYFRQITDNAYTDLRISLSNREVTVFTKDGHPKRIGELSRGTREQLLLCLRLGLIEEYEESGEPLPVALDDLLVNFDPVRARQTARALTSFAKERQVFLFSCHPKMSEIFDDQSINVLKMT